MDSQRHVDALLDEHEGPVFPESLAELISQLDRGSVFELLLAHAGSEIPGFQGMVRNARTSDGYDWPHGMRFSTTSGSFLLLIPWKTSQDQTQWNRSFAVYTQGSRTDEVEDVLTGLTGVVRRFGDEAEADAAECRVRRARH